MVLEVFPWPAAEWFVCELTPIASCILTLGPKLIVLLGEAIEHLGGRASLGDGVLEVS